MPPANNSESKDWYNRDSKMPPDPGIRLSRGNLDNLHEKQAVHQQGSTQDATEADHSSHGSILPPESSLPAWETDSRPYNRVTNALTGGEVYQQDSGRPISEEPNLQTILEDDTLEADTLEAATIKTAGPQQRLPKHEKTPEEKLARYQRVEKLKARFKKERSQRTAAKNLAKALENGPKPKGPPRVRHEPVKPEEQLAVVNGRVRKTPHKWMKQG